jgi:hypothetical protein
MPEVLVGGCGRQRHVGQGLLGGPAGMRVEESLHTPMAPSARTPGGSPCTVRCPVPLEMCMQELGQSSQGVGGRGRYACCCPLRGGGGGRGEAI